MKKFISKVYVLLVLAFIMMTVSCGKADRTEKDDVTEDSSVESSVDNAIVEDVGTQETIVPADNTESTDIKEPVATVDPTVAPEPTAAAETTVTTEPTVTTVPTEITEVVPNAVSTSSGLETIEETVLFDRDGIRVTAKELATDFWGKGINVLIENDTDKNIGIMSMTYIVNNYMCMNFVFSSIAPNSESSDTIPLYAADIAVKGIDIISEVAVSFLVFDNDSGNNLFVTDEAAIPTSAYGTVQQPLMADGKGLINQNGVRIVGKYVDENSSWGIGVLLYIENTTEGDILFQCDDMLINGISIYPFFINQVNQGREALEAITIMDYDLSDNNITEIKDIVLTFSGVDPIDNNILYSFEPVKITVGE